MRDKLGYNGDNLRFIDDSAFVTSETVGTSRVPAISSKHFLGTGALGSIMR